MRLTEIPIEQLRGAAWNANFMDEEMVEHLRESVKRYGLVENLVVRQLAADCFEVLSGNQRLKLLHEMGLSPVPCFVVDVDDSHARLLAQALNHIRGQDDLGLRAELVKEVLKTIPATQVTALLPETAQGLRGLASLGQESIAAYLQNWQQAQSVRLRNLLFKLTPAQLEVVEEALSQMLPAARGSLDKSPNVKGTALYLLCRAHLERTEPR
jgi:ParB family transcriptional regulator, chromosome partitioning protein